MAARVDVVPTDEVRGEGHKEDDTKEIVDAIMNKKGNIKRQNTLIIKGESFL